MKLIWSSSMVLLFTPFLSHLTQQGCGENACPVIAPIDAVGLSQNQVDTSILLDDYVSDQNHSDAEMSYTVRVSNTVVSASIDSGSHVLTLTGSATETGDAEVVVTVMDPEGCKDETSFAVRIHPNRACTTTFSYNANTYGAVNSIFAAGQFNNWSATATSLTDNDRDGIYTSAALTLDAGWVQYKLVKNGTEWIQDPANPYRAWDGGYENSEVKIPDCNQPLLTLTSLDINETTRSVTASVYYQDGNQGSGPQDASLDLTLGGDNVPFEYDAFRRELLVTASNLNPNKYSLRANANSNSGLAADQLFVPIWLESTPFTWRDSTLYFSFTDRFADGKSSNNSAVSGVDSKANYQGGDWAGIKSKLETGYFDAMGVDAIWISPQLENTNDAWEGDDGRMYSAYHGYWPTDPDRLEARLGTDPDLVALIEAAHAREIRVMFDLVSNHVHNQHPYWQQHFISNDSADDWFNAYALCNEDDNWNQKAETCWFAWYLPDLDFKNSDALHTLAADALRYIQLYDIDGYRVDAVKHVAKAYIYHLAADVERFVEHERDDAQSQFYLVGETFTGEWASTCDNTSNCSQYLIKQYIGDDLLDGQFDFPLYWEVLTAFARYESTLSDLASMLQQSKTYYSDATMSVFLGNHDVARYVSHANGDIYDQWGDGAKEQGWTNPPADPTTYPPYQKLQLGFTFLATIGMGVPLVYYGDDIGLAGAGDPDNRRFMEFGTQLSSYQSATLGYLQDLLTLRRDHPSLSSSDWTMLLGSDPDVMVYGKESTNETSIVALNRSGASRTVTVNVSSIGMVNGTVLHDVIGGGSVTVSNNSISMTLGAYSAAILF